MLRALRRHCTRRHCTRLRGVFTRRELTISGFPSRIKSVPWAGCDHREYGRCLRTENQERQRQRANGHPLQAFRVHFGSLAPWFVNSWFVGTRYCRVWMKLLQEKDGDSFIYDGKAQCTQRIKSARAPQTPILTMDQVFSPWTTWISATLHTFFCRLRTRSHL